MEKITISKELVEICEYAYRRGFADGIHIIEENPMIENYKPILEEGIKKTRKHFNLI